jgi:hypothetical protein
VVQAAVWGGFLALLFSFASICFGPNLTFLVGEGVCSLIMVAAIVEGLVARYHQHWILERHRAERLRLLRFGWLVDPRHWDVRADALPAISQALQTKVNDIVAAGEPEMKQWGRETLLPAVTMPAVPPPAEAVEAARQRYISTRLHHQLSYFLDMAERRERLDAPTRILPAIGFGAAVLLSFVHLIGEVVGEARGGITQPVQAATQIDVPRQWLLFLILVLPAAGAAGRLLRTAFEFARNRQRFVTTAFELERVRGWLDMAKDPADVALAMAKAEDALAQEHREWLRLMQEAEWFG